MMKTAGGSLLRLVNARTGDLSITLKGQNDGVLSIDDAGKRRLVYQVNGSFLRVFRDRAELAAGQQQTIVDFSDGRFPAGKMRGD